MSGVVRVSKFVTVIEDRNNEAIRGVLSGVVQLTKKTSDTSKVVKFARQTLEVIGAWMGSVGREPPASLVGSVKTLGTAYAVLGATRLGSVTQNGIEAIQDGTKGTFARLRDITDGVATCLYTAALFVGANVLDAAGKLSLASDLASLPLDAGDVQLAIGLARRFDETAPTTTSPALRSRVEDTIRLAWIKLAKTVASVATGLFAVLAVFTSSPVVSGSTLLGIGMVATTCGLYAAYFEKACDQKPIDLERVRNAIVRRQQVYV